MASIRRHSIVIPWNLHWHWPTASVSWNEVGMTLEWYRNDFDTDTLGLFQSMLLSLPDKVAGNVNFGCGTIGTEQRGSKVVVICCSRDFLNETLDLEGNSHSWLWQDCDESLSQSYIIAVSFQKSILIILVSFYCHFYVIPWHWDTRSRVIYRGTSCVKIIQASF